MSDLVKASTAQVVKNNLDKHREAIMKSLPAGFNYDRMCRSLINSVSTTPTIAECTPSSIFLAAVRAFSLGLEPNGALSEGYLVPFNNKGVKEAQFMPSYRGLIALARRSGEVSTVYANVICAKDKFEAEEGTNRHILHRPDYFAKDRGEAIGYYAVFTTKSGDFDFEIMSRAEVDEIRETSTAKNSGPWVQWYDEMAKKTVMKRLLKRAPMSVEMAAAVRLDNAIHSGEDVAEIIDMGEIQPDPDPVERSSFERQEQGKEE